MSLIIHVSGKVQGVYFRASARAKAAELGITTSAQNLTDGRVKLIAEGDEKALQRFVEWCHEGPPAARVDHVQVEPSGPQDPGGSTTSDRSQ